jgi:hypothetical protein
MSDSEVRYTRLDITTAPIHGRDVEFRSVTLGNLDVTDDEDMPRTFRGYAAVFNAESEPLPFIETIRPGAFRRSLNSGREIRMFVNHNSDMVLGSTRSGTITLTEDERGLLVEGTLPDTTYGRDLSILMRRGDVHSMSFGFSVPKGGDAWSGDGQTRELQEVVLHEVSVVTGFPAYPDTSATVRSSDESDPEPIDDTPEAPVAVPISVLRRLNDLYAKKA